MLTSNRHRESGYPHSLCHTTLRCGSGFRDMRPDLPEISSSHFVSRPPDLHQRQVLNYRWNVFEGTPAKSRAIGLAKSMAALARSCGETQDSYQAVPSA